MQPHVKQLSIFVRTPIWFSKSPVTTACILCTLVTKGWNSRIICQPRCAWEVPERSCHGGWSMMIEGLADQLAAQTDFCQPNAEIAKNPDIAYMITPNFSVGCWKITTESPHLNAIQQPNVKVLFEEPVKVTESSVPGKDGIEVIDVDTVVFATGFDTSFRPALSIVGKEELGSEGAVGGAARGTSWADSTRHALLFFTLIGPSWPIANGSVIGPLETVSDYIVMFLKMTQKELFCSFVVRQDITDAVNEHVEDTVWSDFGRSCYKDPEHGRVNAVWPGSSLRYIEATRR